MPLEDEPRGADEKPDRDDGGRTATGRIDGGVHRIGSLSVFRCRSHGDALAVSP